MNFGSINDINELHDDDDEDEDDDDEDDDDNDDDDDDNDVSSPDLMTANFPRQTVIADRRRSESFVLIGMEKWGIVERRRLGLGGSLSGKSCGGISSS